MASAISIQSKKPMERFGHPLAHDGARYYISSVSGLADAAVDMRAAQLRAEGHMVMEKDLVNIREDVERERRVHTRKIERLGIPDSLEALISAESKREMERTAAALTISEYDLFLLAHNAKQLGFTHRSKFPSFVPDHLQIKDQDSQGIRDDPSKFGKTDFHIFKERKVINVHMFEREAEWHCFSFTYTDDEEADNHWIGGPHLHYVSYLWPRLSKTDVWESFDERKDRASGGEHVRFLPFNESSGPGMGSGSTTDFMFPAEVKNELAPMPTAMLLTRGIWVADISIPAQST